MNILARLYHSTLGKKILVAVTGAGLFVFIVGHLLGNLQIFLGPEVINRYGHFLQTTPEILWPARIGLLIFVGIHIWTSVALTVENRAARAVRYEVKRVVDASIASRTMIWSGLLIAAYVVYHLLQFTLMTTDPGYRTLEYTLVDGVKCHDVYRMMVLGFSNGWVSAAYIVAMGLLCTHLGHGVGAMFQSLGLKNEAWIARINGFSIIVAVLIFAGYASIPVTVLMGLVK
ncbi:MAG TPA: succinate dehydrogenase cytochrome b subunit [Verrucomicrobiae bacterium]|nr:succinate dehydrogenase cytochrome b subunit [Verrucomicrobiae bacterium]